MAGKKPIIRVRAFRGTELNYDANGNIKNENNTIAYEYGSKLWLLFLRNLKLNGYCKVSVENVHEVVGDSVYKEIEDISKFEEELQTAFIGDVTEKLTPDQKRIAELEAKLEKLLNANSTDNKVVKKDIVENIIDAEELKAEYKKLSGKKPHHLWKEERLIEEIDKLKQ